MHFNYLSKLLKKHRKNCDKTQQEIANLLGINRSTYSYYESGKTLPDLRTVVRLSEIFGISYDSLLQPESGIKLLSDSNNTFLSFTIQENQTQETDEDTLKEFLRVTSRLGEEDMKKLLKIAKMFLEN